MGAVATQEAGAVCQSALVRLLAHRAELLAPFAAVVTAQHSKPRRRLQLTKLRRLNKHRLHLRRRKRMRRRPKRLCAPVGVSAMLIDDWVLVKGGCSARVRGCDARP